MLFNEDKDISDTIAALGSCREELDRNIVENIVQRNKEMKNSFFLYLTEGLLVDFELAVLAYQRTKDSFQVVKQAYDYQKTHTLHRPTAERMAWEVEHTMSKGEFLNVCSRIWDNLALQTRETVKDDGKKMINNRIDFIAAFIDVYRERALGQYAEKLAKIASSTGINPADVNLLNKELDAKNWKLNFKPFKFNPTAPNEYGNTRFMGNFGILWRDASQKLINKPR